jgi:CubicO group peptidase (beta-lactamase class C family)
LGAVIEKLSGMSYYAYVRENVFAPAGMKDSDWLEKDKLPPNTALGYTYQDRPVVGPEDRRDPNSRTLPGKGSSAGGGYSTLRDLRAFVKAMRDGVVSTPDFPADGLGIAGGAPGINALLDSGRDYAVIVLSNYDPPTAEQAARRIRAWMPK